MKMGKYSKPAMAKDYYWYYHNYPNLHRPGMSPIHPEAIRLPASNKSPVFQPYWIPSLLHSC